MMRKIIETMAVGALAVILASCSGERPGNLGINNGKLSECPESPNCVSSQATDDAHHIGPLAFNGSPEEAFSRLKEILSGRTDTKIVDEKPGYLRVEFRTTFFTDDGEFFLDAGHHVVQVRSASRVGYWDLGKNRRRIEEIRNAFQPQAERSWLIQHNGSDTQ